MNTEHAATNGTTLGTHAIVIGGSMAGLITARVLIDHFDHVTVVERDHLPDEAVQRAGVPQARHTHLLLLQGLRILEQLFPGLPQELAAAGAESIVWTSQLGYYFQGHWAPRFPSDFRVYSSSRTLLETLIRCRLRQDGRIQFVDGQEVTGLLTDRPGRITGIRMRARGGAAGTSGEDELRATLVVDASGRDSHTPDWLMARPNTKLHMARNGRAYAVIHSPRSDGACHADIEVIATTGKVCGTAVFPGEPYAGFCVAGLTVGYDGTVIDRLVNTFFNDGTSNYNCNFRWWTGFLH